MNLCKFVADTSIDHSMRRFSAVLIAMFALAICIDQCKAQLCGQLTGATHTENFNSLAATGSSNTSVPIGFGFVEVGGNVTYAASDGSTFDGNTYSFGTGTSTDRAFGEITSSTVKSTIGACFVNATNQAIPSFSIGYTGEQWSLGAGDLNPDRLDFQYSTNATALTNGTWIDLDSLDFITPNNVDSYGPMNGNAAVNRVVFSPTSITPSASIQPGAVLFIRWQSTIIAGPNDGLAIDDFSISSPEPSTCLLLTICLATTLCCRPRKAL